MNIFGGGGGGKGKAGGGGRKAKEDKDNLDSTSYAKIIELLSEGEIEGFSTPSRLALTQNTTEYNNAALKDIFFNKTPLLSSTADNSAPQEADFNFSNVTTVTRFGTQSQQYVPGFDAVEEEIAVGSNVVFGVPITKTITDTNVDAVRVTINVPILQTINKKGDILGAEIILNIKVQYNGGGFTTVVNDADGTIKGRTSDLYQRDYIISIAGAFPVDIRVERITPDSTTVKLADAFSWFSYTELIYQKFKYPNSAYVALRIDAEQFNSIPSRSYKIRGIKVAIPDNATVDVETGALTYAGIWSGTFGGAKWTTDPAWILWDLITSTRYGFGDHIEASQLDKWAFFQASKYCNELVPTGLTAPAPAVEPRFSCNVNIQSKEEAYKLINDMCSVFRAMPFWAAGSLAVMQDRPSDPTALLSLGNVTPEGFTYSGSSLKTRSTCVIVGWLNLELGDIDREVVEDNDAIAKYGVIAKEVSAFACTSRSQANRLGRWLLYSERYERETVAFTTSVENGIIVRPGSIIQIADPVKSGVRRAGRISSATTTDITIDNVVDVPAAGTLSVVLPDGTIENQFYSTLAGSVITVDSPFSIAPQNGAMWLVEDTAVEPTTWRVLGITESDGVLYSVSAISYDASKYAHVDEGAPLQTRNISVLNAVPATPENLQGLEVLYELSGRIASKLVVTWEGVRGVNDYRVRWRAANDNWSERKVYGPSYDIENATAGLYQVEVYAISASQVLSSAPATLTFNVAGTAGAPANVTGVSLVPINESSAIIQWDLATDLDVLVGGEVLIRHDPRTVAAGATWEASNAIVKAVAGSETQKQVPLLEGTYFLVFRDQSGVRSVTPTIVAAILPTPQPRLVVKTWAEQDDVPSFGSVDSVNLSDVDPLYAGLVLFYGITHDSGSANQAYVNNDLSGGTASTDYSALTTVDSSNAAGTGLPPTTATDGFYVYEDALDLGQVYDINIRRYIISSPVVFGELFDTVAGDFDDQAGVFESTGSDAVNAAAYVRVTNDNPNATPTWGEWNEYANAIVRGRGIQLKVEATSLSKQTSILITELGATAELQQRTETASLSGSSTYNVLFATTGSNFYAAPTVNISPSDMATGDFFTLTSVARTGFTVAFKDSASAAVTRSFTYTAVGFGREI